MAKRKNTTGKSGATSANVGYEAQLWQMADALRDTLLPKLISGGLRFRYAEPFTEDNT